MIEFKQRGLVLDTNQGVKLLITIKDQYGNPIATDAIPRLAIVQPGGLVYLAQTSTGIVQDLDQQGNPILGQFYYNFTVPLNGPYGVWNDIWTAQVNGYALTQTLSFIVSGTQIPENPSSDGLLHLGDEFPTQYSQQSIFNINKLLKMLKERLNSDGKSVSKDAYGNTTYINCSNFSISTLVTFLSMSLSHFNLVPYVTYFDFDDTEFVGQYGEMIVQIAAAFAMYSKSLIERGAELTLSDNGITFTPAQVADFLRGQADTIMNGYAETLKSLKNTMRPLPLGLSTFDIGSSDKSPVVKALSRRRENKII
jgi:hypothetical protein